MQGLRCPFVAPAMSLRELVQADSHDQVGVAAVNSVRAVVLSGSEEGASTQKALDRLGKVPSIRLGNKFAFHSPLTGAY